VQTRKQNIIHTVLISMLELRYHMFNPLISDQVGQTTHE